MACRDESRWVRESLASALGQTHRELELLVVDDGSTDETAAIVESMQDPRIKLIRLTASGACVARNAGLSEARGALIQILDADDVLAPDKIERQVARWSEEGDSVVYFGPFAQFDDDLAQARFEPRANWKDMDGHAWLVSAWSDGGMMAPHSWLTPAGIARAADRWDDTLLQNQDGEYFSRVLLASSGARFCDQARSYYRVTRKKSISRRTDHAARSSRLRSTCLIAERLLAVDDGARTRGACGNAFEELMYMTYPQFPDIHEAARSRLEEVGGSDGSQPFRGPLFKLGVRLLGWRGARQIQRRWRLALEALRLRRLSSD